MKVVDGTNRKGAKQMRQLIITGNGFDLACGLHSSYNDFFLARFSSLFADVMRAKGIDNLASLNEGEVERFLDGVRDRIERAIALVDLEVGHPVDYFERCAGDWAPTTDVPSITRWDVIFLFADKYLDKALNAYQWQDVENIIYNVVSFVASDLTGMKFETNLAFVPTPGLGGEGEFRDLVLKLAYTGHGLGNEIMENLLVDLRKFEAIFSDYIYAQAARGDYWDRATALFDQLTRYDTRHRTHKRVDQVDVLTFNYSLDERFGRRLNDRLANVEVTSWSNIHGIASRHVPGVNDALPAPIFGIDNHDIINDQVKNDLRVPFTKAYRVLDNGVNTIRKRIDYSGVGLITTFGHSLNRADYSYFETLFDNCQLYSSDTRLEVFYYVGKEKALAAVVNLLTDYGMTLGETHGENIVNKLELEKRLDVVPVELLDDQLVH